VDTATAGCVYDANTCIPSVLTDGTLKYVYGLGLTYAVNGSGNVQVYHTDGLGSVRAITNLDPQISVIETDQTDAFGNPTRTQGGVSQPFPFTGQQRDASTGLYYLRARMDDPTARRCVESDPLGSQLELPPSVNRYSYVRSNPGRATHPSCLHAAAPRVLLGAPVPENHSVHSTLPGAGGRRGRHHPESPPSRFAPHPLTGAIVPSLATTELDDQSGDELCPCSLNPELVRHPGVSMHRELLRRLAPAG
jgi:RHS repeat-associated protein